MESGSCDDHNRYLSLTDRHIRMWVVTNSGESCGAGRICAITFYPTVALGRIMG